MLIFDKLKSFFGSSRQENAVDSPNSDLLRKTAETLDELRGENISPQPGLNKPTASENVAEAARDYGLSRFTGETDAMGGAADGYRSSK